MISYPRNIFWGKVVILNLENQDNKCRKIAGKIGRGTILGISFKVCWMESQDKLKWNNDWDIQHSPVFLSM